jgi:outer membrane protein assembly factor BamE
MRMLFRHGRSPALTASLSTLCIALAASLSACASKNPLIDGAPSAKSSDTVKTAAAPGQRPVDGPKSAAPMATGVQTTKERRFFFGLLTPYRPEIQQGNFVSEEMVSQLREGMTRDQVRFVLGTPLLADIFHGERWDYPFRLVKRDGEVTTSRVSVFFKDNLVARFEGGDLPTEEEYLARLTSSKPPPKRFVPPANPNPAPVPSAVTEPR